MGIPKDKLNYMFQQLPSNYQDNVLDYMEFLLEKASKNHWDNIPEIDEPLNDEEKQLLNDDSGYVTGKEAKSEFRLQVDLP
ncbi:hypothetical protein [Shimazuella kribbensis]|uniref:hypothetical protein n=1 Tax=Shimazuella kribbensis TaxID=139808 RepID=UPI0003F6B078|nr:hypothetical protein [Shimazuella kribbensis]